MKKSTYRILAIILTLVLLLQNIVIVQADTTQPIMPKQKMLVKFKEDKNGFEKNEKYKEIKQFKKFKGGNIFQVNIDSETLKMLKDDSDIELIEEDSQIEKLDDKIAWNIEKVNAIKLQEMKYYGEGINVAIFDTGIDLNNADLNVKGGISFIDGITSYNDDNGHGTAVAGIISAAKDNQGLLGIAPNVNLYSVKVLDRDGVGQYSNIIEGLQWAVDNNINIIVMSFGGSQYSEILEDAINQANSKGILMIAASGNEGTTDSIYYPANYRNIVCVGAVDKDNKIASFSNKGYQMDLVAPGVDIETTYLNNSLIEIDGTSAAVPHVAGVAAQLWSANRSLTNDQLKALLYKSAVTLGEKETFGWGIVDAETSFNNINSSYELPADYDVEPGQAGTDTSDGTVNVASTIVSGDQQTIYTGDSATVGIRFDEEHTSVTITTYKADTNQIVHTDTKSVVQDITTYYTCPGEAFTTAGTYMIKFHADGVDPIWDTVFTIFVENRPQSAPTNVSATATSTSICISWSSVTGATSYDIKKDGVLVDNVTSPYSHSGLTPNTMHTYQVGANGTDGIGWSRSISKYTLANMPTNGTLGNVTNSGITVSWSSNGNASGTQYSVIVYKSGFLGWSKISTDSWITSQTKTISGLEADTLYMFQVKARNGDGVESSVLTAGEAKTLPNPPAAPTGLKAVGKSNTYIKLTWNSTYNADGYDLELDGRTEYSVGNPYIDDSLVPGSLHQYRVRAKNAGGTSPWSDRIDIYTFANMPYGGRIDSTTGNSIKASWNANGNSPITEYSVGVFEPFLFWVRQVNTESWTTSLTDTVGGLNTNKDYTVKVKARNKSGEETDWLEIGTARTTNTPIGGLQKPVFGTSKVQENSIKLSWSSVPGATKYDIRRFNVTADKNTESPTGTPEATFVTTDITFTDIGLKANNQYSYTVRARNATDVSKWAEKTTVTTPPESQNGRGGTTVGDPVNIVTGNFYTNAVDISISDIGQDIQIVRNYNSRDTESGSLGIGWRLDYDSNIKIDNSTGNAEIAYPDGRILVYDVISGTDDYNTPLNAFDKLVKNIDGSFTLELQNKTLYTYDTNGNLVKLTDINNNSITINRDASGNITSVVGASGKPLTFTYENNKLKKVVDQEERKVEYFYNADGKLETVKDVNYSTTSYTYNDKGLTSITDQNNKKYLINEYDEDGRVIKQYDENGNESIIPYDDLYMENTYDRGSQGGKVKYSYNELLQVTKITYDDETYEEFTYDQWGNKSSVRDRNGHTTSYVYNENGKMLSVTTPEPYSYTTSYEYDNNDNLVKVLRSNIPILLYEYDEKGNLLKKIEKLDSSTEAVTKYTYDSYGRILTETDPEENTTTYEYGSEIGPIKITDPEKNETTFTYDELGRKLTMTTSYGTTNYVYNEKDKIEKLIDPLKNVTRMKYDSRGNLIKKILPEQYNQISDDGDGYTYVYDGMDRQIKEIDPLNAVKAIKYDAVGNKIKDINPNYYNADTDDGLGISYVYDENNRLIKTINPSLQQSRIKYDAVGNIIKSIDANNYDESTDDGLGTEYMYDELNRLTLVKDAYGNITKQYVYDSSNRVIKESDAKGYLSGTSESTRYGTLYTYNLAGWVLEVRKPVKLENGTIYYNITRYTYNKNGSVIEEKKSPDYITNTSEPLKWYTITYTYDRNGRTKSVSDTTGAFIEYTYDSLGNIIQEKSKIADTKFNIIGYNYDTAGRMDKRWTLVEAGDLKDGGIGTVKAETSYEYDKNGNVVKETSSEGYVTHYEYDIAGRLTSKKQEVVKNTVSIDSTSILISSPRKTAYPGKEYDYKVDLVPGMTVTGANISIVYDSRLIEIVSAVSANPEVTINSINLGNIVISVAATNYTTQATLATLRIKVKNNIKGIGFISIEPTSTYVDENGKSKKFTELTGKTITIQGPDMNNDGNVETNDLTLAAKRKDIGSDNPNYEEKFDINDNGIVDVEDIDYIKDWLFNNESSKLNNIAFAKFYQKYSNVSYEENNISTLRETTYQYDKAGNIVRETDCNKNSISYIYDAYNRIAVSEDKEGNKTRFFYDEVGNLVKEVSAENYDEITDDGIGTSYIYDSANRLSQVLDSQDNVIQKNIYDIKGMIAKTIDAKGYLSASSDDLRYGIEYTYDLGNRVINIVTPEAKSKGMISESYTYDSLGNVITSADGQGNITTYERDLWGKATAIKDAKDIYTYYAYDLAGNVISAKDRNQKTTSYSYNSMNLLQSITDPGKQTITYKYDKEGRVALEKDRNGQTILYSYNNDNNLVSKSIQGKEDFEKYLYNQDGSLLAAINANGVEYYEYTQNGYIKKKSRNGHPLLEYEYDKNGNVTKVTDQTGKFISYTYDTLGRMETVTDDGVQIADYNYNIDNTLESIKYSTGITTAYSYDKDKNITSLVAKNPQGAVINNISYTYDSNGNQLTKVENNKTITYTYDQLNRLATVQYPELGLETYTYDNEGNRKTKVLGTNTTSYLYDSRNKLVQSTNNSIITSYNYDKNGNLLDESKNGQKITYTYDGFNHLKEVNLSNDTWMYNEYNAAGERIAIAENGVRSDFIIDRGNVIAEIDPSTQNYTRSVRGLGLLAQSDPDGVIGYYLNNAHGDVTNVVDSNGQVLNSYQYDAFGNTTSYVEKVTNRFMYSGEQFDKLTGQYYLRARYYNPVIGRFTQEDTYRGDGLNLYIYVSNNPIRYVDPSGHDKEDINESELFRRMENGETVIWDGVTQALLNAKAKFEAAIKAKGWRISYNSAYRPYEYQKHLYELNQKVQNGKATKAEINDYKRHGLVGVVAKPNANAPHTRGVAFDAIVKNQNGIALNGKDSNGKQFMKDELLKVVKSSGLFTIFKPKPDLIHFQVAE